MNNLPALNKCGINVTKQFGTLMANGLFRLFRQNEDFSVAEIAEAMEEFRNDVNKMAQHGVMRTVISAESLVDLKPEEIDVLKAEMLKIFDDIKILLYIRRQDLCGSSHYSTALRGGGLSKGLMSERFGPGKRAVRYDTLIDDWGNAFGDENLIVRIFEKPLLISGNVVDDFYSTLGVDVSEIEEVDAQNTSLQSDAQAFLRYYNEVVAAKEGVSYLVATKARNKLVKILETVSSGPGLKPSRETALNYYEEFRKGNEKVRQKFFSDQPTLFNEDFSDYPEVADFIDDLCTAEIIMQQFVKVWLEDSKG